eukprot:COSAG01_NODE_959_length_12451_cov_18.389815_10_plen_87_part_00
MSDAAPVRPHEQVIPPTTASLRDGHEIDCHIHEIDYHLRDGRRPRQSLSSRHCVWRRVAAEVPKRSKLVVKRQHVSDIRRHKPGRV